MSDDDLFETFMEELLRPDTEFTIGDTGETMTFAQLMALADGAPPPAPKRGTDEYRQLVSYVAQQDDVEGVGNMILGMQEDYGWKAVLDVMAEWALQVERGAATQEDRFREPLSGAVDMARLIVIHADEEQKLLIATDKKNQYVKTGLPAHEAFRKAAQDTEASLTFLQGWYPYYSAALRAAHTTGDRRAIVAELFKAPGRQETQGLVQSALILATAAYHVRHYNEMHVAMQAAAGDAPVAHDESIAPGWGNGGYVRRTFLRKEN
ncbi:hypothetical protein ACFPC0_10765 [Streptomyces andamanensis]|uniref:Uncharacterized protein n=1 Tax=Streptomyces andamanensis TaxID=1565035 RepID=A0ABV8TCL1_9ACTN